jgi:hypothetical protein
LRQGHIATGGDGADNVFDPIDLLGPERLAEPDREFVNLQPTPLRGEEMAEFMDDDEDVEEENDLSKREEREAGGGVTVVVTENSDKENHEPKKSEQPGIGEYGAIHELIKGTDVLNTDFTIKQTEARL